MRVLATIVALSLGPPSASPGPADEEAPAVVTEDADRSYSGTTAIERPEGAYGELPPRWWAGENAKEEPPRVIEDDLFVDPTAPIGPEETSRAGGPPRRPDVEVDPLHLLADEDPPDGRGLLIASGVFAGLAALSGLAVGVLAHSHIACLRDESSLSLVPCGEQVSAHQTAVLLSTGLFVAATPFLAAGGVSHGRHITREKTKPPLEDFMARRRMAGGVSALVLGAGMIGTALATVTPVMLGTCKDDCSARSISSQVLWWSGAITLGVGVGLVAYTHGRTHPARPKRIRLSPRVSHTGAGLGLSGRF